MRTGNTRMAGIPIGDLAREQVGAITAGALEKTEAHGYTLKLLPMPLGGTVEVARNVVRLSSELRLQGAIALHVSSEAVAIFEAAAKRYNYPLLLLDTRAPHCALPSVTSDDESGICAAIAHLAALGHRRIALLAGASFDAIVMLRKPLFDGPYSAIVRKRRQ